MIGSTISHYRVVAKLGQGGMGDVYLAEDERLERRVALKFLAPELARDRHALVRFRNEAKAAADLKHPNIATIHDLGEVDGRPFLVFEYVEGRTLRERALEGPLPIEDVVRIGKGLAAGLAHAHARGIVHRDIKSANVMLTAEGEVKILDFGLARYGDATLMTRPGTVVGTIAYMSPEQVQGKVADHRSDIWSAGVVLFECLTGAMPFVGEGAAVFEQIRSAPVAAPTTVREGIPFELEHAVLRCLEKDSSIRYQHADELLGALRAFETHETSGSALARSGARPGSGRITAVPVTAILVLIVVMAFWWKPWESGDGRYSLPDRFSAPPLLTPLLSSPASKSSLAWSPMGNLIAYSSGASGSDDIWICDPDGSNPINLTGRPGGRDSFPAWSPDASRIAFFSDRDGAGIYTMSVTGGNVRRLCGVNPSLPANGQFVICWPDADRIIYVDMPGGRHDAYEFMLGSGATRCLTGEVDGGAAMPRISPDGRFLSFRKPVLGIDVGHSVLDLETGEVHELPLDALESHWASDSRTLLMISNADGSRDLWAQGIDSRSGAALGSPRRLTTAFPISDLSVSPDGTRAAAIRLERTSNVWSLSTREASRVDLEMAEQLTHDGFTHQSARWLNDGTGFVDVSDRRGTVNTWVVDSRSGESVRIIDRPAGMAHPAPDDSWLILHLLAEDGAVFPYSIRRDGSELHELAPELRDRFHFVLVTDWSADGSRVAFHTKDGDPWRFGVIEVDLETRAAGPMHLLPQRGSIPFFSPDGLHLVYQGYASDRRELFVTDLSGDTVTQLTDNDFDEWVTGWEAEPSTIYFKHGVTDDTWRLRVGGDFLPVGEPQLWFPGDEGLKVSQFLDFRDGRALGPLSLARSDMWLLQFAGADSD